MHTPHIGETVLVHHKDCFSNNAQTVPAMITQVFEPSGGIQYVNLLAFPPFAQPKHLGSVTWYPSTPLIKDEHFVGAWPRNTHHTRVGEADTSRDEA